MALTRIEKLDRKGILHFEVDDVFARLTARQSKSADLAARARPIVGAAAILASHIRARASKGGGADGQIRMTRNGKRPIGNWSGGMWRGIEAKGEGARGAAIGFAGQSVAESGMFGDLGRGSKFREQFAAGTVRQKTLDTMRNDLKAGSVWARHDRYNVIEPSAAEWLAVGEAIGQDVQQSIMIALGGGLTGVDAVGVLMGGADPALRAKLAAFWVH